MRSRLLLLSLSLCCLSSVSSAQTSGPGVLPGRSAGSSASSTLLTTNTTTACTAADLVETNLWSAFTLPANTLNENGKHIRITAWGTAASNANAKTVKLYFGSELLATATGAVNGSSWRIDATVERTGAATETHVSLSKWGSVVDGDQSGALTQDLTAGVAIRITGQNGVATASDICFSAGNVELLQASTTTIVTSTGGVVANPILLPNGAVGAPALSFGTAPTVGLYLLDPNSVGYSAGNSDVLRLDASGLAFATGSALSWTSGSSSTTKDVRLFRDAAGTLAQRDGTNAQASRIYRDFTSAGNVSYMEAGTSGTNAYIGAITTTGAPGTSILNLNIGSAPNISLITGGATRWNVNAAGHITAGLDNSYDIGASGATRPRNYFGAGTVQTGVFTVAGLATCNAAAKGATAFVSDATATTFLSAVVGGGANNVPVVCDGTSWKIG